jgi:hypothetical protein
MQRDKSHQKIRKSEGGLRFPLGLAYHSRGNEKLPAGRELSQINEEAIC